MVLKDKFYQHLAEEGICKEMPLSNMGVAEIRKLLLHYFLQLQIDRTVKRILVITSVGVICYQV